MITFKNMLPFVVLGMAVKIGTAIAVVEAVDTIAQSMVENSEDEETSFYEDDVFEEPTVNYNVSYISAIKVENTEMVVSYQEANRFREPLCGRRFMRDACDCLP